MSLFLIFSLLFEIMILYYLHEVILSLHVYVTLKQQGVNHVSTNKTKSS